MLCVMKFSFMCLLLLTLFIVLGCSASKETLEDRHNSVIEAFLAGDGDYLFGEGLESFAGFLVDKTYTMFVDETHFQNTFNRKGEEYTYTLISVLNFSLNDGSSFSTFLFTYDTRFLEHPYPQSVHLKYLEHNILTTGYVRNAASQIDLDEFYFHDDELVFSGWPASGASSADVYVRDELRCDSVILRNATKTWIDGSSSTFFVLPCSFFPEDYGYVQFDTGDIFHFYISKLELYPVIYFD